MGQLAANHPNDALQYLREPINRGYKDADGLMADTDLEKLRPNSNFLDGNRNPAKNDLQTAVALASADINAQKWGRPALVTESLLDIRQLPVLRCKFAWHRKCGTPRSKMHRAYSTPS